MSDLIKTSLSLENCSFHPRGERSWAGSGLKNDLALKARVFPTLFGAVLRGPAVRWVPPGYRQLTKELRAGFLGIHHFHPLRRRHFIMRDHPVKQYDAAHFYLSRFTKSPIQPAEEQQKPGSSAAAAGGHSFHSVPERKATGRTNAGGEGPERPGARSSGVAPERHTSLRFAPALGLPAGVGRKRLFLPVSD